MDEIDTGRCETTWASPRSGQPLRCVLDAGHEGECRCAGWWRDEDMRATQHKGEGHDG